MIDDGRYDPAEKKIENHERALNDFIYWERELRALKLKKHERSRVRKILTAFGNALTYPQINPWGFF